MFTGIIQTTAKIAKRKVSGRSGKLALLFDSPLPSPEKGESIAVNGACLTLEKFTGDGRTLEFHVLAETFKRTNLGVLPTGAKVNIERALTLNARLGGHFVTGHIDASSPICKWKKIGEDWELSVKYPAELAPYLVEKGSVALDGISLTIAAVEKTFFTVHIIPLTKNSTSLKERKAGDIVNIETDALGKYVLKSMASPNPKKKEGIDMKMLEDSGWELVFRSTNK